MNFPLFLSANDRTIRVVGEMDTTTEYVNNKGYVKDDTVWVFSSDGKPKNANKLPYFWIENGEKKYSSPSETTIFNFNTKRLIDIASCSIIENTVDGEVLYNEQAINDMIAASDIYIPALREDDDFLKRVIKEVIISRQINLNRLKCKMGAIYSLNNMKAALKNKTKMSPLYFLQWCEILSIDFKLIVSDSGEDPIDPLKEPLVYNSVKNDVVPLSESGIIIEQ